MRWGWRWVGCAVASRGTVRAARCGTFGVMLADGGDALCDLRVLRDEAGLFGAVASDATA